MARELHDEVAQPLVALMVRIEELKRTLGAGDVTLELAGIQESVRHVLRSTRELLVDLRDQQNLRLNFVSVLRDDLLPRFQGSGEQVVELHVSSSWPSEIGGWAAFNLYRIIQEALTNARRHSHARLVVVSLAVSDEGIAMVRVIDDGYGMVGALPSMGTIGMNERAVILGATVVVFATDHGGTAVEVSFPAHRLL